MAALDAVMRCSIGSASMQLVDYSIARTKNLDEETGLITGSTVTLEGEGYLEATSASGLTAAIAAFVSAMDAADGQNITIYGLNSTAELVLSAGGCINGGPIVDWQIEKQQSAGQFRKHVSFTATAQTLTGSGLDDDGGGGGDDPASENRYKVSTGTGADGRRTVAYEGSLTYPGASAWLIDTFIAGLTDKYPRERWVEKHMIEAAGKGDGLGGGADDSFDYTVTFEELAEDLPAEPDEVTIYDGEVTQTRQKDSRGPVSFTWTYELLFSGPRSALEAAIRPAGTIIAETSELSTLKGRRLRASFTTLVGPDAAVADLLEWNRRVESTGTKGHEDPKVKAAEYGLITPQLYWAEQMAYTAVETGRATGLRFVEAPSPIFSANLSEAPRVSYEMLDDQVCQTTWTYLYVATGRDELKVTAGVAAKLRRPAAGDVRFL
jgi:hypothetical protein